MGKANRARRAAKHRKRQAERVRSEPVAHRAPSSADPPLTDADLLRMAVDLQLAEHPDLLRALDELSIRPQARVTQLIALELERAVASVWDGGWSPADLARAARRHTAAAARDLVLIAALVQARAYAALGHEVAPAWMEELSALEGHAAVGGPWPDELGLPGRAWPAVVEAAVEALAFLRMCAPIPVVLAPPREWRSGMPSLNSSSVVDDKLLRRVRALLAKAESSDFEDEASSFTAKAQELMARHRIDRALLVDSADAPVERARMAVDDPYASAKAHLLGRIAAANGCKAVWDKWAGSCTVFGHRGELEVVDLLFTSLLVQATRAMATGASRSANKRGYRQSFLMGFTSRIAARLAEGVASAVAEAEAEAGVEVLPVLARDLEAVVAAVDEACPNLRRLKLSISDGEGWRAGQAAGDVADLTTPRSRVSSGGAG
jgi:hypothetical protein